LYTGLSGMGVAYFVSRRGEVAFGRRLAVALGLFGSAVAAHFLWNSPYLNFFPSSVDNVGDWLRIPFAAAVKGAPLLLFLVVVVRLGPQRGRVRPATRAPSAPRRPRRPRREAVAKREHPRGGGAGGRRLRGRSGGGATTGPL